jgi:hypothetical protein
MHNSVFCDFFLKRKEKNMGFDYMMFQSFRGVKVSCHFLGCLLTIRNYVCGEKHIIFVLVEAEIKVCRVLHVQMKHVLEISR